MIGFDGAFTQPSSTSAASITLGAQIAIDEINARGGVLNGRPLKLVTEDNHGISARARDNFKSLAVMPDLVAIYGGKFSPTIMETMPLANELKVVSVSLWGSANPITDDPLKNPYVYRLSLKDSWAIPAMMRQALDAHSATRLCALFPNTAWGRSGANALDLNLAQTAQQLVHSKWYQWGQTDFAADLQNCIDAGGQAVIMVANEGEGAAIINSMATLPDKERLPIVSHWGVTGGLLHQLIKPSAGLVDVDIIQTFSFVDNPRPTAQALAREVMQRTGVLNVALISSPVGVAQAYDMTHLLALGVEQAGSTDRAAVQAALQTLPPFAGAIRDYDRPFTDTNHDGLTAKQVLFVHIEPDGALLPVPENGPSK
ncbi:ABC transporter substrate-binding protein [Orrella daihaiensis]|uniref:ABC transporter substrate-binding protein n=1 Tax=Orrella daihaiensis TaxID=2782176 RepID=A0ABY4AJ11_9BURK|nr:ABC transporter substrate-binding protein [Orrella daihaiensis]